MQLLQDPRSAIGTCRLDSGFSSMGAPLGHAFGISELFSESRVAAGKRRLKDLEVRLRRSFFEQNGY